MVGENMQKHCENYARLCNILCGSGAPYDLGQDMKWYVFVAFMDVVMIIPQ